MYVIFVSPLVTFFVVDSKAVVVPERFKREHAGHHNQNLEDEVELTGAY
jgi:hypothetical protein